jgi:hypothetical protein
MGNKAARGTSSTTKRSPRSDNTFSIAGNSLRTSSTGSRLTSAALRDSLSSWFPNTTKNADFSMEFQPEFECTFTDDTIGNDLKCRWCAYRESAAGSFRNTAFDSFLSKLSATLKGQDTDGIATNLPSLPPEVVYGLIAQVREQSGIQIATPEHGHGVVKYYNVTREHIGSRLGSATSDFMVSEVGKLCLTIECLEKLAQSPYYRTTMHLARTTHVIVGVTKAALSLHNIDAQNLLNTAKRKDRDVRSRDRERKEEEDVINSEKESVETIRLRRATTRVLRRLVVSVACLICRLTEHCGVWRYGNVMAPTMKEPDDSEKVRNARRNAASINAPYFCDELLDAIKLLMSISKGQYAKQHSSEDCQTRNVEENHEKEEEIPTTYLSAILFDLLGSCLTSLSSGTSLQYFQRRIRDRAGLHAMVEVVGHGTQKDESITLLQLHTQLLSLHVMREAIRGCTDNVAWLDEVRSYKAICHVVLCSTKFTDNSVLGDTWASHAWGKRNDWFRVTGDLFGDRTIENNNLHRRMHRSALPSEDVGWSTTVAGTRSANTAGYGFSFYNGNTSSSVQNSTCLIPGVVIAIRAAFDAVHWMMFPPNTLTHRAATEKIKYNHDRRRNSHTEQKIEPSTSAAFVIKVILTVYQTHSSSSAFKSTSMLLEPLSIQVNLLIHTVRILSSIAATMAIDLSFRLFQRYHVWNLLLSSECFFMSGPKKEIVQSGATHMAATQIYDCENEDEDKDEDEDNQNLQDNQNNQNNQENIKFSHLVLIASTSDAAHAASLAIECRRRVLDLLNGMITKAALDNRVNAVALEVRALVLAVERVVTTTIAQADDICQTDAITIQLARCLHVMMARDTSGQLQRGLTNSHMLPQLISCAARHLQDTLHTTATASRQSSTKFYVERSEITNDTADANVQPQSGDLSSPLGVAVRSNYFPPPISTARGISPRLLSSMSLSSSTLFEDVDWLPPHNTRSRSPNSPSSPSSSPSSSPPLPNTALLPTDAANDSVWTLQHTTTSAVSTSSTTVSSRPLLWAARNSILQVLETHLAPPTKAFTTSINEVAFEAVSFALYHGALEFAHSGELPPLATLVFGLLTEPGKPAIRASLTILKSMLSTMILLLARLRSDLLQGPLRMATSSDGASSALSALQSELFRRTAQFVGSLSASEYGTISTSSSSFSPSTSLPLLLAPKETYTATLHMTLNMLTNLALVPQNTACVQNYLRETNCLQLLITTVYKFQKVENKSMEIDERPTLSAAVYCSNNQEHLLVLHSVMRTLTSMLYGNRRAKDYMQHTIGYHQLLEAILLCRMSIDVSIPSTVMTLVWYMVFDHVQKEDSEEESEEPGDGEAHAPTPGLYEETGLPESTTAMTGIIKNMGALSVLVALLPEVSEEDQRTTLTSLHSIFQGPVGIQNRSACGQAEPPVLDQILNVLPLLKRMPIKLLAIQVIEALGSHSISVGSLKRLLRSLQSPRGGGNMVHAYRPALATRLLRAIRNMIPLDATPRHFFYFDGSATSCLSLPPIPKWPTKGYAFHVWLKVMDKKRTSGGRQNILSFRTPSSRGLELSLQNFEIVLRMPGVRLDSQGKLKREKSMKTMKKVNRIRKNVSASDGINSTDDAAAFFRTGRVLSTRSWHSITLTQAPSTTFLGVKGSTSVYVDGVRVWSREDVPYLSFGNDSSAGDGGPTINAIGRKMTSSTHSDSFHGCISSFRMFDQPLDQTQVEDIHVLGYDYFGSFDAIEDVVQRACDQVAPKRKTRLLDGSLSKAIKMAFNAGVLNNSGFLNTTERPKLRPKTTKNSKSRRSKVSSFLLFSSPSVAIASNGACPITNHHVRDVLDSLGGVRVLFPIFAQFSLPDENGSYEPEPELGVEVIELIGAMLRHNVTNQHFVQVADGFSLLAHLLERVSPEYMTSDTITAIVNLCTRVRFSELYLTKVLKHVLTNFRLWLFTPLGTQLHVFNVILHEAQTNVERFRSSDVLGVPRLLAALRLYYWIEPPTVLDGGDQWVRAMQLEHPVTKEITGRRLIGDELVEARLSMFRILNHIFLPARPTTFRMTTPQRRNSSKGDSEPTTTRRRQSAAQDVREVHALLGAVASTTCLQERYEFLSFALNLMKSSTNRAQRFVTSMSKSNNFAGSVSTNNNKLGCINVFLVMLSNEYDVKTRCIVIELLGFIVDTCRNMSTTPIKALTLRISSFAKLVARECTKSVLDHHMYMSIIRAILGRQHEDEDKTSNYFSIPRSTTTGVTTRNTIGISNRTTLSGISVSLGRGNRNGMSNGAHQPPSSDALAENQKASTLLQATANVTATEVKARTAHITDAGANRNDNEHFSSSVKAEGKPTHRYKNISSSVVDSSHFSNNEATAHPTKTTGKGLSRGSGGVNNNGNNDSGSRSGAPRLSPVNLAQCDIRNPEFLCVLCDMLTVSDTPVDIRVRALEDVSLLLTQKHNLDAVLRQFPWQQWLLKVLSACSMVQSKSSDSLIDNILGIFRLLHLHAVRRSEASGGGNKMHQGGCEVLKNTMMHIRRAAASSDEYHQIDSLSLSSAMLQQLLHGMQREVANLNEAIRKDPDDYESGIALSKLLGSIWHVAFFVSDQIYYPAPSPANKGGAWVTPAKMNSRKGSIRELSEASTDQSPTRMLATPRFKIVERAPSPKPSPTRKEMNLNNVSESPSDGKADSKLPATSTASTSSIATVCLTPTAASTPPLASTTSTTSTTSKTRYMDSGLQLVDGLLRLLIDSKLDLWSEAPMLQSTTRKTRGARGSRPGGALRVVVHLIVHSIQDTLNFSRMNSRGDTLKSAGGAIRNTVVEIDAEHRDYLSYLEQLMSRSSGVVNTSTREWQRTMLLAAAELASISRIHAAHLSDDNDIHRLLVSLVTSHSALFKMQLDSLQSLEQEGEENNATEGTLLLSSDSLLSSLRNALGVQFGWSDWDHAVGFVVSEEQESRSELARIIVDEQMESMLKMDKSMVLLSRTQKGYVDGHGNLSANEMSGKHSIRDRTKLKRLVRWRSDLNEIAWSNWNKVLRDLTTERGLWSQRAYDTVDELNSAVFWKIQSYEDGQHRRRLLVRNYHGTKHEGRQPSMSRREARESSLAAAARADADNNKNTSNKHRGLWQELMSASALRLRSTTRTSPSNSSEIVVEGEMKELNSEEEEKGDSIHYSHHHNHHHHVESGDLEPPLLSLPCDIIIPMLELSATIEVEATSITVVVDESAMESLTTDQKELLHPQRLRRWNFSDLRDLATRRHQMQQCAVEFFLADGTQCFVSLRTLQARKQLCRIIRRLMPKNFAPLLNLSPTERLKRSGATSAWMKREISTFEYLMIVNRMAGRSYEDLGQYPVFPWILSDYTSETLDLNDSTCYRDLKKPMGAQSIAREAKFREKYDTYHGNGMDVDPGDIDMTILMGPASMYGTHYSNPGIVISYLMRTEPFMSYHVHLQDGRFDKPDRQIQSIALTYSGCTDTNNTSDVKELIPEYFYNPEVLVNTNHVDFGTTSNGIKLDDIVLPPWAHGSPEKFIQIQRAALESEYVSAHLHHWIDMIFGIKQRPPFLDDGSQLAVQSCNVFFHISYEGAVDMEMLRQTRPDLFKTVVSMLLNFGQTPPQVFQKGHLRRPPISEPIFPLFSEILGLGGEKQRDRHHRQQQEHHHQQRRAASATSNVHRNKDRSDSILSKSSASDVSDISTSNPSPSRHSHLSMPGNSPRRDVIHALRSSSTTTVSTNSNQLLRKSSGKYSRKRVVLKKTHKIVGYSPVRLNLQEAPVIYAHPMPRTGKLVTIDTSRTLCLHKWVSQEPDVEPPFSLEIDPTNVTTSKTCSKMYRPRHVVLGHVRKIGTPFAGIVGVGHSGGSNIESTIGASSTQSMARSVSENRRQSLLQQEVVEESRALLLQGTTFRVNTSCFAACDTKGLIFSCGHWDTTFQVMDGSTGSALQSISYHHGTVTCIEHSAMSDVLTSSTSSSVGSSASSSSSTFTSEPKISSCVRVGSMTVSSVLVTGSEDCTVAVWGVQTRAADSNGDHDKVNGNSRGNDSPSTPPRASDSISSRNSSGTPLSSIGSMADMAALSSLTSSQSANDIFVRNRSGDGVSGVQGDRSRGWRPIVPYPLLVLYGHDAPVTSVSVSCDLGIVISGSEDGTVIVYSLTDGAYIRTIGKSSILKSPDLAAVPQRRQEVDATAPGLSVMMVDDDIHSSRCGSVTWVGTTSAGGCIALYYGDGMLLRVYTLNGKLLSEIEINERLHALMFSEDGNYLITGGTSRIVKVHDIRNSLVEARRINGYMKSSPLLPQGLPAFESSIHSLSLTPKERHLVVGLSNGCVRILALDAQYLRDRLQERLSSLGF